MNIPRGDGAYRRLEGSSFMFLLHDLEDLSPSSIAGAVFYSAFKVRYGGGSISYLHQPEAQERNVVHLEEFFLKGITDALELEPDVNNLPEFKQHVEKRAISGQVFCALHEILFNEMDCIDFFTFDYEKVRLSLKLRKFLFEEHELFDDNCALYELGKTIAVNHLGYKPSGDSPAFISSDGSRVAMFVGRPRKNFP